MNLVDFNYGQRRYFRTETKRIFIHSSATTAWMDEITREDIERWHRNRTPPFRDIGYHFVLTRKATLELGRPIMEQGAHTRGHNDDSIGICLVGGAGLECDDSLNEDILISENNFTQQQFILLRLLLLGLCKHFNIHPDNIFGHRDVANTECPGFDVSTWVKENLKELYQ